MQVQKEEKGEGKGGGQKKKKCTIEGNIFDLAELSEGQASLTLNSSCQSNTLARKFNKIFFWNLSILIYYSI